MIAGCVPLRSLRAFPIEGLLSLLETYSVEVRQGLIPDLAHVTHRGLGSPLVATDGLHITLARGALEETIWGVAHCFAHMIQWHARDPSSLHTAFRVGAAEARHLACLPLWRLRGSAFRRSIVQEFEAHLLTAAVLNSSYPSQSASNLIDIALQKAETDLSRLSGSRVNPDNRKPYIQRESKRFSRKVKGLPTLPPPAEVSLEPLSHRFIPYLWLDR